jgi:hypothetical protein
MHIIKRSLSISRPAPHLKHKSPLSEEDYYVIECMNNGFCIREELKCYKLEEGDRVQIMGGELIKDDPHLLSFLWMLKYRPLEDTFEIIHVRTDLSLASDNFECVLEHGSMADKQSFTLQPVKKDVYRIRDYKDNYLSLDGILQPNDYI